MRIPRLLPLVLCFLVSLATSVRALITGGTGSAPVTDRDWPLGTLDVANHYTRLGYWEGPPLGGGESHFLYRGDTVAFQEALYLFARIRAPERRLIINEGVEESFWLKDPKRPDANIRVDWSFIVWTPRSWHSLYSNPKSTFSLGAPGGAFGSPVPPPTLSVNVPPSTANGEVIDWSKIKIPEGLTVVDERATSAGYSRDDGSVIRGDIYDLLTSKPIAGAQVRLLKPGKNPDIIVAEIQSDGAGHFELKHVQPGSAGVRISAPGYATRSLGNEVFGANTFKQHVVQLAKPIAASGTVKSTEGKPLAGVKVRLGSILGLDGRGYPLTDPREAVTDAQGNFELQGLPEGYFQLFANDESHYQLDVFHIFGPPNNGMPAKVYSDIALIMTATGSVKGKVLNADGTPAIDANVDINPVGELIGHWGGGMHVKPDGTFEFPKVPPGQYTISTMRQIPGLPKDPAAKIIEVKAGEALEVNLTKEAPRPVRRGLP